MTEHKFDVWRKEPSMLNTRSEFICKMHTEDPNVIDFKVQGWRCACRCTTVNNAYSQKSEERHLLVGNN